MRMNSFTSFFMEELKKPSIRNLLRDVNKSYESKTIFPPHKDVLNAFKFTPYDRVKVVIVGQDPYHEVNQAHGLAFSTLDKKLPPSLNNIFKEYVDDLGYEFPKSGNLTKWAKNGVLLLNSILTVEEHKALACESEAYEELYLDVIKFLSKREKPIVFILWGNKAIKANKYIDKRHFILTSAHPSPLSSYRGFFGSKPFSKANEILRQNGLEEVDWKLD